MTTLLRQGNGGQAPRRRDRAARGVGRFYAQGRKLTTDLLDTRKTLPTAANNKPVACSDSHVEDIMKAMRQERSAEFERLLEVAAGFWRDGVARHLIVAPFRELLADVEAICCGAQLVREVPIEVATLSETRVQGRADVRQGFAALHPESLEALRAARADTVEHIAKLETLRDVYDREIAMLTMSPLRSVTRGGMQVMS